MSETFRVKLKIVSIKVPVWYKGGMVVYRRDCLDFDHPEHIYNWIKSNIPCVEPEDFGYFKPEGYDAKMRDFIERERWGFN